jgi:predicted flap endonuclease-1-like 5' DNA nuclease
MKSKKQQSHRKKKQNQKPNLNFNHHNKPVPPITIPIIERDDLLAIEGIHPTVELALNSIGILTYSDFDGYTPETLSQALQKRAGISVTTQMIEDQKWLEQAKKLAQIIPSDQQLSQEKNQVQNMKNNDQIKLETDKEKLDEKHMVDSDESSGMVKPIASEQTSQSRDHQQKRLKDFNKLVTLKITEVKFDPSEISLPDGTKAKKMRAEIYWTLDGDNIASIIQNRCLICAQIHAINTKTNEARLVATTFSQPLPEQNRYKNYLEFDIPPIGYYRLASVVFLLDQEATIDFHQGPFLKVISE